MILCPLLSRAESPLNRCGITDGARLLFVRGSRGDHVGDATYTIGGRNHLRTLHIGQNESSMFQ